MPNYMSTDTKSLTKNSYTMAGNAKDLEIEFKLKQATLEHGTDYDPNNLFPKLIDEMEKNKENNPEVIKFVNRALSLFEFNNGVLMISAVSEEYRTFCIEFSRNLQKEYHCETPSEKATTELVAVNFVRTLEIQRKINGYLSMGETTEMGIKYFAVLSKELDRANRHYLNVLQTLKMLKQPVLEVIIKTQTAVVGQNQIIQANNYDKAK